MENIGGQNGKILDLHTHFVVTCFRPCPSMKIASELLLLPFSIIIIFTRCDNAPENKLVDISDDAFLAALIERGVDADGDGKISTEEAEAVLTLDVRGKQISDLTGIEDFINLNTLDCMDNRLSNLDITNNTALQFLGCAYNSLDVLDVSKNTLLEGLDIGHNILTSLDFSDNTGLISLQCSDNQLTTLNVSNNTILGILHISNMPSLGEVCVWTMPFPPEAIRLDTTGSPNVYFTTECSQ